LILSNLEFNIVCDPEAAEIVLSNVELAAKTILIPLDVTHQVRVTKDIQKLLLYGKLGDESTPSTLRIMLVELVNFFSKTYDDIFGISDGPPLHDPLAVAAIFDGIKEFEIPFYDVRYDEDSGKEVKERWHVDVDTRGTHEDALRGLTQTGRTRLKALPAGEAGVKVPRSLDVAKFWSVLEDCVEMADKHNGRGKGFDKLKEILEGEGVKVDLEQHLSIGANLESE
jgi:uridine nucleosidase